MPGVLSFKTMPTLFMCGVCGIPFDFCFILMVRLVVRGGRANAQRAHAHTHTRTHTDTHTHTHTHRHTHIHTHTVTKRLIERGALAKK